MKGNKVSLLAAVTVSITLVLQMKVLLNNKFNITYDHNKTDTILVHEDARPLPPTIEQDKKPNNPDLLLSVPFYVYEDEFLNNSLWNITEIYESQRGWKDEIHDSNNETKTFMEYAEHYKYYKQFGDVHFIRSALQHPMRVLNPEDAKLFVVPCLITYTMHMLLYNDPENDPETILKNKKRLEKANEVLGASPWFLRNDGADHIAPVGWWSAKDPLSKHFERLTRCNFVQFADDPSDPSYIHPDYKTNRSMFKIFYVGTPCEPVASFAQKTRDFVFVGNIEPHKFSINKGVRENFHSRKDVCEWMTRHTNHSYSVCGRGDQCPHLSEALLGFHIRGDTMSANRLFDTLLSGTVPVFTLKDQYKSQSDFYDWDKISYFANVSNETTFLEDMNKNLSNKTDMMVKTKNVLDNRDLFDWQTLVPFDV